MKINVLLTKELIDVSKLNDNYIVVVLDILLATSTITACLANGANNIYAAVNQKEALEMSSSFSNPPLLVGEKDGETIDGFLEPTPLSLKFLVKNRDIVLATTNGTIAIRKAKNAKQTIIASLLNGQAVAKNLVKNSTEEVTIQLLCSGSAGNFCTEDFYGAGYIVDSIVSLQKDVVLTDSAWSAKTFYSQLQCASNDVLQKTEVGAYLQKKGFAEDLLYVSKQGIYEVVPKVTDGKVHA